MNVGSTFSGVGGIDLGLERAGMRVLWNAEQDEWCRDVLRHHWPDAEQYADVRDVARRSPGGRVDLLCGGFPCQDLSVAGKRRGLAGDRSGLFHEFARIADAVRPGWLLIENVPGLLSSNDGRDFGVVLHTLVELGYGVAWRVLDSRYFGVPQRRRRVFIVGRAGGDHASALHALCESCKGSPPAGQCSWQGAPTGAGGRVARSLNAGSRYDGDSSSLGVNPPGRRQEDDENLVAVTLMGKRGRGGGGLDPSETLIANTLTKRHAGTSTSRDGASDNLVGMQDAASARRLTPRECERLQGFPDDWTLIPGQKCPDSRRYAAMGNAVTVPVAEWIGRRIIACG